MSQRAKTTGCDIMAALLAAALPVFAQAAANGPELPGAVAASIRAGPGLESPSPGKASAIVVASAGRLAGYIPEALQGYKRVSQREHELAESSTTEASASFVGPNDARFRLTLTRSQAQARLARQSGDREVDDAGRVSRVSRDAQTGWLVIEEFRRDGSRGNLRVVMKNDLIVQFAARRVAQRELHELFRRLPLDRLAAY